MTEKSDEIKITAQPALDENICRFLVDRPVYADGSFNCMSAEAAKGSPLLEALFAIDGVARLFVSGEVVVVAKEGEKDWQTLGKEIGNVIRERMASGGTLICRDDATSETKEADIRRKVEELFDKQINPGISTHGGFVKLVDVKGSVVHLTMGGGCQGCGAAQMTLKLGIERAIFSQVPEVTEVVDITDHQAGENPYYQPEAQEK